jgi:hypothetical protein
MAMHGLRSESHTGNLPIMAVQSSLWEYSAPALKLKSVLN